MFVSALNITFEIDRHYGVVNAHSDKNPAVASVHSHALVIVGRYGKSAFACIFSELFNNSCDIAFKVGAGIFEVYADFDLFDGSF